MRLYNHPFWLLLIAIFPTAILIFLFYTEYNIIVSYLDDSAATSWLIGFVLLGFVLFMQILHLIFRQQHRDLLSNKDAWILLVGYGLVTSYLYSLNETMFPTSIPNWLLRNAIFNYTGTFFMPIIIYALFILIQHYTKDIKEASAFYNFSIAILPPMFIAFVMLVIMPMWQTPTVGFSLHLGIVLIVLGIITFLYYFLRGIFVFFKKHNRNNATNSYAWKFIFGLLLPLIGLNLNNSLLAINNDEGIFGNFNHPLFYIIAIVNGVLLMLPISSKTIFHLIKFIALSSTFAYTVYFLIVFIPWIPVGIIAILALGIGFIILSPIVLFITQVSVLIEDYKTLKVTYGNWKILAIGIVSFLFFPALLIVNLYQQKHNLHQALEYVFTPDYNKNYDIDIDQITYCIENVKSHKDRRRNRSERNTPFISNLYQSIVLENMTLSDEKLQRMQKVFLNESNNEQNPTIILNETKDVEIVKVQKMSIYDSKKSIWKSTIELNIKNTTPNNLMEYRTVFSIPESAKISNYYLYIEGRKEYGILAEKKAATWIYNSIVNVNKDPGILYYVNNYEMAFRVFPFNAKETRITGMEIIHKEPISITIGSQLVQLGDPMKIETSPIESSDDVFFVSSKHKEQLPVIHRKPYLHFILDMSEGSEASFSKYQQQIAFLQNEYPEYMINAKISFSNSNFETIDFAPNWKDKMHPIKKKEGFFLDRVLRKELSNHYLDGKEVYPVFMILSNHLDKAIIDASYKDLKFMMPDNHYAYTLNTDNQLQAIDLWKTDFEKEFSIVKYFKSTNPVIVYKKPDQSFVYLPNDSNGNVVINNDNIIIDEADIAINDWNTAMQIQGKWMQSHINPITLQQSWIAMVRASFLSNNMAQVTSFIALENDSQKELLKQKQEKALNANPIMDVGEDVVQMSEPELWMLLFLIPIYCIWNHRKKGKLKIAY